MGRRERKKVLLQWCCYNGGRGEGIVLVQMGKASGKIQGLVQMSKA